MNKLKILFLTLFVALGISGCDDDDRFVAPNISVPQNIDASFSIKQDNSGEVTIIPTAEGANFFYVNFGDGSEVTEEFETGKSVSHVYEEGNYTVELFARNMEGEVVSAEKQLVVSFRAPEDLEVAITISSNNPLEVSVEASAQFAFGFEMTFGEDEDLDPIFVLAGDIGVYEYSSVGTFTVTVVALSGGEATTTYTEDITITDPFVLPITFESSTVNYNFNNFGGGEGNGVPIIDNPDPNEVNDSPKVGSYTKVAGSEVWAGTSALLNENIDFSSTTTIAVDVWSPQAGIPVLFKIEQEGNPDIFVESEQNTTVADQWETLVFTLPGANQNDFSILALFFNFGTSGTGETYYFDNIRLTNPVVLGLPLDFEEDPNVYNFIEFQGAPTEVVPNPDMSGINTSSNVAKTLKATGAGNFAGSFIDLNNPIDLGISSTLSLKVWSPATTQVLIKLEDLNSDAEFEVLQDVNTANEWVELQYDFSGADSSIEWARVIFFFDFNLPGNGLEFYFDDLNYVTEASDDLVGTWVVANENGSLGVGPAVGDVSWFNCNGPCLTERACYFDDTYTFNNDGTFTNGFGAGDTWVEAWQGVDGDQCEAPVAPHDGSNPATYNYNVANNTITLTGEGAFIGLPKAVNEGELPNVSLPSSVTYNVSFESPSVMNVYIESGSGVFWQYKLVKQ